MTVASMDRRRRVKSPRIQGSACYDSREKYEPDVEVSQACAPATRRLNG